MPAGQMCSHPNKWLRSMVAEVFERERSRMQLGPRARTSQWATGAETASASSSKLPAAGFKTPSGQPAGVQHGTNLAGNLHSAASPASGALSGLARRHALPGVLRFGGGVRSLYEWRLLMKVCSFMVAKAAVRACPCTARSGGIANAPNCIAYVTSLS